MDARSCASHMSTCTTIMRGRTRARSHANNVSSAADPTAAVHGTPFVSRGTKECGSRAGKRKVVPSTSCEGTKHSPYAHTWARDARAQVQRDGRRTETKRQQSDEGCTKAKRPEMDRRCTVSGSRRMPRLLRVLARPAVGTLTSSFSLFSSSAAPMASKCRLLAVASPVRCVCALSPHSDARPQHAHPQHAHPQHAHTATL